MAGEAQEDGDQSRKKLGRRAKIDHVNANK